MKLPTLAEVSKAAAALAAGVVALAAQGIVNTDTEHVVVGILGAVGIFAATYKSPPNKKNPLS